MIKMNYKPLNGRVLVKLDKQEEKTAGGIILAVQSQNASVYGVVEATAEDVTSVKVGDRVLLDKFSTKENVGENLAIVEEEEILATLF